MGVNLPQVVYCQQHTRGESPTLDWRNLSLAWTDVENTTAQSLKLSVVLKPILSREVPVAGYRLEAGIRGE
ncbi:MAG: hypothetical protein IT447_08945 [Phycisphaerales bacterium]|jgi:hypothetical protein|nr:hypothetical protein [Phycisphaerales bacterium]